VPLVIKVLSKSMDSSLSGEKVELATLTRDDSGKVQFKIFEAAEIQPLLDAAKAEKEKEEAASS
jgi:20S proteasome subunit alpha 3